MRSCWMALQVHPPCLRHTGWKIQTFHPGYPMLHDLQPRHHHAHSDLPSCHLHASATTAQKQLSTSPGISPALSSIVIEIMNCSEGIQTLTNHLQAWTSYVMTKYDKDTYKKPSKEQNSSNFNRIPPLRRSKWPWLKFLGRTRSLSDSLWKIRAFSVASKSTMTSLPDGLALGWSLHV